MTTTEALALTAKPIPYDLAHVFFAEVRQRLNDGEIIGREMLCRWCETHKDRLTALNAEPEPWKDPNMSVICENCGEPFGLHGGGDDAPCTKCKDGDNVRDVRGSLIFTGTCFKPKDLAALRKEAKS